MLTMAAFRAGPRSSSCIAEALSPARGGRATDRYTRDAYDGKSSHRSMAKFFSGAGSRLTISRRSKIPASLHQQHARRSAPAERDGLDSAIRRFSRSAVPRMTQADSDDTEPQARTALGDSVVCATFPMHDASVVRHLKAPAFVNAGEPDAGPRSASRISVAVSRARGGCASRRNTRPVGDTKSAHGRGTQFFCRAGYRLTLGRRRNILASLHQQHTRSSAPIDRGGLDSFIRRLPRSLVLWSIRPNSDDAGPHVRAAVGDSGVYAAFPMHDAPVVQHQEAPTLNFTRKKALGHVLVRASPNLKVLHVLATPLAVTPGVPWTQKAATG
ncbi:hypothetical protein MRX96_039036 [Rhipicephalus microplus]